MRYAAPMLAVVFSACAAMFPLYTYQPRNVVEVQDSEFEPHVTFVGVEVPYDTSYAANVHFLRSWLDKKTGALYHQLYVVNYYRGDWRFWRSANNANAEPLDFVSIERDVVSCSGYGSCLHSETFGISIPHDALLANRDGYSLKVYAQSGRSMVLRITARQIAAQLEAIARHRPAT
ncbi:MAG TPA: hypothetical protein VF158_11240 [Longimicrobiales bacterium]